MNSITGTKNRIGERFFSSISGGLNENLEIGVSHLYLQAD